MEALPCQTYDTSVFRLGEKTHMIKFLQGLVNDHVSENKFTQEIISGKK